MAGSKLHYCSLCGGSFFTRAALDEHRAAHEETESAQLLCDVCRWPFSDSLKLEEHKVATGHATPQAHCVTCDEAFKSVAAYNNHRKFPAPCSDSMKHLYKKSSKVPGNKPSPPVAQPSREPEHKRHPGYFDHVAAEAAEAADAEKSSIPSDRPATPSEVSGIYCRSCKKTFESQAGFFRHVLGCSNLLVSNSMRDENVLSTTKKATSSEDLFPQANPTQRIYSVLTSPAVATYSSSRPEKRHQAPPVLSVRRDSASKINKGASVATVSSAQPRTDLGTFACKTVGCGKTFRSEAGLSMHQEDLHGVGGKGLDLQGKDSWMLSQRAREQLKNQVLLQSPASSPQPGCRPPTPKMRDWLTLRSPFPPKTVTASRSVVVAPPPEPVSESIGGRAEIEQANYIQDKILQLLIQTDVSIQHDGKMLCSGIAWTRIGLQKQPDVVGMLDKLIHIPMKLQGTEYLPTPKTFRDEYEVNHPVAEFLYSPERISDKPGQRVVAISCSKIVMANGCQEAVKIAAVDVLSCRILVDYLICSDPKAPVREWRTKDTGLSSFQDLEAARQAGFMVLKGWQAARAALYKFVDKETIIMGHNLRSDLDALRMIHGRAVDIAKVVEKVANGPMSKQQLSLDSLCREFPEVHPTTHAKFGRNCLQDAFAIREFGLWALKQGEEMTKKAKQKTLEYHRVRGI